MALLGKRDLIEAHLDPPPGPELVEGLAGPLIGHPLVGIHELVHAHACERPRAPALTCGAETLSYAELDSRVGVLARALRRRGLDRGTVAGVCLPRSADLVVAVLAVLRARAAFLPL